jgi:hypothetical protein
MEARFEHDFSQVRVHTDSQAGESARDVNAQAYTVGRNVVFGHGDFQPRTPEGRLLLAHELVHVVQQAAPRTAGQGMLDDRQAEGAERKAESAAIGAVAGQRVTSLRSSLDAPRLQRQVYGTPSPVSVRSPVLEEFVTQASTVQAALVGRPLNAAELRLARGVFAGSIDYSRVRLIPTGVLEYRTVANTIRIPEKFTLTNDYMAQTLIHELTHVWQYQHGGTSYISISLATQIAGTIRSGSRNAAYEYQIAPGASFFEFKPEQQGSIVENYFAMLRDLKAPPRMQTSDRMAEIARELPLHQPLIKQMQAALPRREADLLTNRATEVMRSPLEGAAPVPPERQVTPVKPIFEVNF